MVQITAIYAALLALLLIFLSAAVIKQRRSKLVGLGDGKDEALRTAIRVHANFTEYVPTALLLVLMLELNNGNNWVIHACGLSLLVGRVLHAIGLNKSIGKSWQRFYGVILTFLSIIIGAVANVLNLVL